MPSLAKIIGENIRLRRRELGLTQEDLAAAAGLDYTTIGAAERGVRHLSVPSLKRVAEALRISLDDLAQVKTDRRGTRRDRLLSEFAALVRSIPDQKIALLSEIAKVIARRS